MYPENIITPLPTQLYTDALLRRSGLFYRVFSLKRNQRYSSIYKLKGDISIKRQMIGLMFHFFVVSGRTTCQNRSKPGLLSVVNISYILKLCYLSLSVFTLQSCSRTTPKDFVASNIYEWVHVLIMNTPCSHLRSLCACDDSSSLATRVAWLECDEELRVQHTRRTASDFIP